MPPAPERRTRWDLTAAAVVALVVLGGWSTLWWASDARRTTLSTAPGPAAGATTAPIESGPMGSGSGATAHVPAALTEAWRAPSPATPVPLVQGGTVVTAAAGMVAGRDLRSGALRWSYRRDRSLCTVAAAFHQVVAVYQRGETCSEVTALNWTDGQRGPQRTGPVQVPTHLVAAGDHLAASGARYLEVWRFDLVRTLAYGRLPTPAQPATQPRPDCLHGSIALGSGQLGPGKLSAGKLAVVEQCPGERARLTVQRADPQDPDRPEVSFSILLPGRQAQVIAVSGERVAVALPDPARLVVFDGQGRAVAEHPLAIPDTDLRSNPPAGVAEVTTTTTEVYWFTGSATVAVDAGELRPQWIRPGSLGTGCEVAGRLLLPVPGALAVLDPVTGRQLGTLPVDRGSYRGPVATASSGGVVLEQRGDTLVALREGLVGSIR
jgi:hypothetical protein